MTALPQRRQDVTVTSLPGEVVVFDPDTEQVHLLTGATADVWEHCDGRTPSAALDRTPHEIAAALEVLAGHNLLASDPGQSRRRVVQLGTVAAGVGLTTMLAPKAFAATSFVGGGAGGGGGVTPGSQTFGYTGSTQPFVVPAGVTQLVITATGGGGGRSFDGSLDEAGGTSGTVHTTLTSSFSPGDTLRVFVGASGGQSLSQAQRPGGANGSAQSSGGEGGVIGAYSAGGGAGTLVVNHTLSDLPLVLAAGGGGAADQAPGGSAGTTGSAAAGSVTPGGSGGDAHDAIGDLQGGGGGGTATGGGSAGTSTRVFYYGGSNDNGEPGAPGNGHTGSPGSGNGADGDFGGGGGGGWTGGGSGARSAGGGAGSSYAIANYSVTAGVSNADGSVTIAWS